MAFDSRKLRWNGWGRSDHVHSVSGREEIWAWLAQQLGMRALLATPPQALEDVTLLPSRLPARDRHLLTALLGENKVCDDIYERARHARGRSYEDLLKLRAGDLSEAPDAVVYPESNEDVLKLLALASERHFAITPFGGGARISTVGAAVRASYAAVISVDLARMNQVAVDQARRTATVQAGIYGPALEGAFAAKGLTLGHFPSTFELSTVGGWIAAGAPNHSENRGPKDWLFGVEIATPRGMLRDRDFGKGSLQLPDLIQCSHGALGIITKATVQLQRAAPERVARAYLFPDFASGASAMHKAWQNDIPATTLQLFDSDASRLLEMLNANQNKQGFVESGMRRIASARNGDADCLFVAEFTDHARSTARAFTRIAWQHGALPLGAAPAKRCLAERFAYLYLRDAMLDHGLGLLTTKVSTSWSKVEAMCDAVKAALNKAIRSTIPRLAHGVATCQIRSSSLNTVELSFECIFPRALSDDLKQAHTVREAALKAAAIVGVSGNGAYSAVSLELMQGIKRTLDPKGILKPGGFIPSPR